jgi:membrane protein
MMVPESAKNASLPEAEGLAWVWEQVSRSPLESLWDFQGVSVWLVLKRTGKAAIDDNLFSRAAELGYYFLFALFPTLICASAILGLAARSATAIYVSLLHYFALVVPPAAFGIVMDTFNQTAAAASGGKFLLGLVGALWSASVGFSAIQDGMNTVYRVREGRPYWKARGIAILVTLLLALLITLNLAVLLGADFATHAVWGHVAQRWLAWSAVIAMRVVAWVFALLMLVVQFSVVYYYAPDLANKRWHWLTPGAAMGIVGWVAASLGLKVYLHYFNSYSLTYGSLGAVIVLLTWFYITGLMLLLGAEINSEIQAAVVERQGVVIKE